MSRRGIFVARVFGVRITVHPTWLFIFGLVVIWYGSAGGPVTGTVLTPLGRWIVAPIAATAFFASVLIHELAHAFVARSRGMRVDEVTLFIFGGAARMDRDAPSARTELAVGLAGPAASGILGAVLVVVGTVLSGMTGVFEAVAAELAVGLGVVNLLLAVFNLVPAFPMDGGRILRALLWSLTHDFERATRLATRLARGFGVVVIGAGLVIAFVVDPVAGLWAGLIGWFIYRAAEGDYRRVQLTRMMEGVVVRDVMDRDVAVVSPTLTLDTFVEQLARGRGRALSGDPGWRPGRHHRRGTGAPRPALSLAHDAHHRHHESLRDALDPDRATAGDGRRRPLPGLARAGHRGRRRCRSSAPARTGDA